MILDEDGDVYLVLVLDKARAWSAGQDAHRHTSAAVTKGPS